MLDESLITPFLAGKKTRPTVINWPNQLRSIVDGYENHKGLVHGVQKDAIQNGWDARTSRRGKDWKFTFELIQGKRHLYLTMTDEGTFGLTGRVLMPEELQEDLPQGERWGRFENLAFTKEHSTTYSTLGSRGRGKFIFLGASKINEIIYDSLRIDETYRFGVRGLKLVDSPTYSWDGEEAIDTLKKMTDDALDPLKKIGTRVVIVDPVDEIVDDIRSGNFLRYINETWWEIILKYKVTIIVKFDGHEYVATVPDEFVLQEEDSKELKVWIKENEAIKAQKTRFKLNKLHIVCNKETPAPNDIQGISIQRGGMKICTIEPRFLPKEIAESIYGYFRLDVDEERALLEAEGPEHYSFNFRRALPRAIKHFVDAELNHFAQKKLGWRSDIRKVRRQKQRNAERRAITAINELARKIGLTGIGTGRKTGDGGGGSSKPIRIHLQNLKFPRSNDKRVNYGEKIQNIIARIINETDRPIKIKFKIFLRFYEKIITEYFDQDIIVASNSASNLIGPFEEQFLPEKHIEKGEYIIVARIISMMDENKGEKLDEKKRKIYLEEEPPTGGIFERCEPVEFPDEIIELMGEAIPGERGGYILQYNTRHPEQESVQDSEDLLAAYLFRLLSYELCRIDVSQEDPRLFAKSDLELPETLLQKTLGLWGEFIYNYHIA